MNTIQTLRRAIQPTILVEEEVKEVIILTSTGHRGVHIHKESFDTLTLSVAKHTDYWLPFWNKTIALPDYLIFCEPTKNTDNQLYAFIVNLPNKPKKTGTWLAKTTMGIKLTTHLLSIFQYQHEQFTLPTPTYRSLVFFNQTHTNYPILKRKRKTTAGKFAYEIETTNNYYYTQKLWPKNKQVGYDLKMFVQ